MAETPVCIVFFIQFDSFGLIWIITMNFTIVLISEWLLYCFELCK
ncbi:hypothetical protein RchiOBHm_Chr1g0383671 [Rosa chinensis]|uniref:Uncharacterized protein n=1 Tax=Rosa chinensis TaxID=74649 RepID=A0A2P6SPQ6_ROSCH|nr:hypothetical protein RchiOBHm_Chr1g0383671 [Rosa chinensis]